jgi:hypothetical protein
LEDFPVEVLVRAVSLIDHAPKEEKGVAAGLSLITENDKPVWWLFYLNDRFLLILIRQEMWFLMNCS